MLDAIAASDGTARVRDPESLQRQGLERDPRQFPDHPTGDTTLNAVAVHRIVDGEVTTMSTVDVPDALVGR